MAGDEVVTSSRRVRKSGGRENSSGRASVGELRNYAERLSEKELWVELDSAYERWLGGDRSAWDGDVQPRLAIFLAREIGRRKGEMGMKEVTTWLDEREVEVKLVDGSFDVSQPTLHTRIRLAGFGGWVSGNPEEAIYRLIKSRKNSEEDWPIINQNPMLGIQAYEISGVEQILRSGFAELAGDDLARAKQLLIDGMNNKVFDVTKIAESVFLRMSEGEIEVFCDELVTIANGGGEGDSLEAGLLSGELGLWTDRGRDDFFARMRPGLPVGVTRMWPPPGGQDLSVLVRARPDFALEVLRDDRADALVRVDLVNRLALVDSRHYGLIAEIPDIEKVAFVKTVLGPNSFQDFGPITGQEKPGALDLGGLRRVVGETEMEGEVRAEIEALLDERLD